MSVGFLLSFENCFRITKGYQQKDSWGHRHYAYLGVFFFHYFFKWEKTAAPIEDTESNNKQNDAFSSQLPRQLDLYLSLQLHLQAFAHMCLCLREQTEVPTRHTATAERWCDIFWTKVLWALQCSEHTYCGSGTVLLQPIVFQNPSLNLAIPDGVYLYRNFCLCRARKISQGQFLSPGFKFWHVIMIVRW